jgi:tripartite-type tricarboxylate transporter receptor subunit TctC
MARRISLAALVCTAMLAAAIDPAAQPADDYPSRPIRIIVTQAAGSGVDLQARLIAQKLAELWGQQVIADNRPGANGIIAMEAAARAKPDGYTLVYSSISILAMNPFIYRKLPYDPFRDFAPITQTTNNTMGLVVGRSLNVKTVAALIALARARPGELNFGSFGVGNMTHLMGELLSSAAGIKMTHVPYKGQTPAIADLLGGQIPLAFTTMAGVTELVQSGQLTLLATFGEERDDTFPDTPTMREAGYPSVVMVGWSGILAPAGVPPQVLRRLHGALAPIVTSPEVKDAFARQGAKAVSSNTPEAFERYIKSQADKFSAIIKAAGLEGTQ